MTALTAYLLSVCIIAPAVAFCCWYQVKRQHDPMTVSHIVQAVFFTLCPIVNIFVFFGIVSALWQEFSDTVVFKAKQ